MYENGSFNNLACYPPDSHQSCNAVYWRTGSLRNAAFFEQINWIRLKLHFRCFKVWHKKEVKVKAILA